MHTACWFTYFERCDLIAPLLEIILKWFIAVTESLAIQLVNKYPQCQPGALTPQSLFYSP